MKRIIPLLLLLPLFTLSCYLFDGGNQWSRSLINFLNNLPEGITKIHVAIYEGYPAGSSNVINTATLNPGASLSMEVPPGELRYFLILAENIEGVVQYTGLSGPYSISESGSTNIVVSMSEISFNPRWDGGLKGLAWDPLPGADTYEVYYSVDGNTSPFTLFGITPATGIPNNDIWGYFKVRAFFSIFNINSKLSISELLG